MSQRSSTPRLLVRSFAVFYGYGPIPTLDGYDLAIVEAAGWREGDLRALRAQGKRTLAYLSTLEATEAMIREAGLVEEDFLKLDGRPWFLEGPRTYVCDPRSPRWQAYLEDKVVALGRAGWTGFLLDGLGDIEHEKVARETGWLIPAAADLVRRIRNWARNGILVMNNGIWLLLPLVAPYLDGVVWETVGLDGRYGEPWVMATVDRLAGVVRQHGVTPFLLTVVGPGSEDRSAVPHDGSRDPVPEEARLAALERFARRYGLVLYAAPADYALGIRSRQGKIVAGGQYWGQTT